MKRSWSCDTQWTVYDFPAGTFMGHGFLNKGAQVCNLAAFRVEYLVTEGARYPSPHCPDRLGGHPLYTLLPPNIKRPVWFEDKVTTEPAISRNWSTPRPLPLVTLASIPSISHVLLSICESRTGCKRVGTGGLWSGFGSAKAWFCGQVSPDFYSGPPVHGLR